MKNEKGQRIASSWTSEWSGGDLLIRCHQNLCTVCNACSCAFQVVSE